MVCIAILDHPTRNVQPLDRNIRLPDPNLPHGRQVVRGRERKQRNAECNDGDGDRKGDEWLDNEEIE